MTTLAVDCTFSEDGSVRVRRIKMGSKWQSVSQGRQWLDQHGRHVLIMLAGEEIREIVLGPTTLAWEIRTFSAGHNIV